MDASHRLVPVTTVLEDVTSVEEVGEDVPPATGDGAFSPPATS